LLSPQERKQTLILEKTMSLVKEIGEVAKAIARSATVTVGTKKAVAAIERGLPNFSAKSKLVWQKAKSTKSTGKQKVDWIEEAKEEEIPDGFSVAAVKNVPATKFSPAINDQTLNDSQQAEVSSETQDKE
jgi:predicted phage tail protein